MCWGWVKGSDASEGKEIGVHLSLALSRTWFHFYRDFFRPSEALQEELR